MTKKIPTSRAKTAYGVLSDIARLTQREPKRMRMAAWGGEANNAGYLDSRLLPACNTVGCIGGWTNLLTGTTGSCHAETVLGLTREQANDLFYGPLCTEDGQGTVRHARRVVGLIRRFQRAHRQQLLAKKVKSVCR